MIFRIGQRQDRSPVLSAIDYVYEMAAQDGIVLPELDKEKVAC